MSRGGDRVLSVERFAERRRWSPRQPARNGFPAPSLELGEGPGHLLGQGLAPVRRLRPGWRYGTSGGDICRVPKASASASGVTVGSSIRVVAAALGRSERVPARRHPRPEPPPRRPVRLGHDRAEAQEVGPHNSDQRVRLAGSLATEAARNARLRCKVNGPRERRSRDAPRARVPRATPSRSAPDWLSWSKTVFVASSCRSADQPAARSSSRCGGGHLLIARRLPGPEEPVGWVISADHGERAARCRIRPQGSGDLPVKSAVSAVAASRRPERRNLDRRADLDAGLGR